MEGQGFLHVGPGSNDLKRASKILQKPFLSPTQRCFCSHQAGLSLWNDPSPVRLSQFSAQTRGPAASPAGDTSVWRQRAEEAMLNSLAAAGLTDSRTGWVFVSHFFFPTALCSWGFSLPSGPLSLSVSFSCLLHF